MQQALLKASSRDTVRRRIYSANRPACSRPAGPTFQDAPGAPEPLPMPLQNLLVGEAHTPASAADDPEVVVMPPGRSWAAANAITPVAELIDGLVSGYDAAVDRMSRTVAARQNR